jgi:hypothetical protein
MIRRAEHDSALIRTGITKVQQKNRTGGISKPSHKATIKTGQHDKIKQEVNFTMRKIRIVK